MLHPTFCTMAIIGLTNLATWSGNDKMPEVGIRVLRDNLSRYLSRVREGEEVIVTDQGKPVARIAPLDRPGLLERLIAEGVVTSPLNRERTSPGRRVRPTAPASPLIIEDRR